MKQVVFGGKVSEEELVVGKKYDRMIERLTFFIEKSYNKTDMQILCKVMRSTTSINIKKIDMIIKELRKIQKAMAQTESISD